MRAPNVALLTGQLRTEAARLLGQTVTSFTAILLRKAADHIEASEALVDRASSALASEMVAATELDTLTKELLELADEAGATGELVVMGTDVSGYCGARPSDIRDAVKRSLERFATNTARALR